MASTTKNNEVRPYAVVDFIKKNKKKLSIDFVPSSWIYNYEGQSFCYFPEPEDYPNLETWLVELKPYEETWNDYVVTVISYAANLEQGKRRLDRALKQRNVESTDTEQNATNEKDTVTILSEKVINKELADVPRMSKDNAPSSSLTNSRKKKKDKPSKNGSQASSLTDPQLIELENDIAKLIDEKFDKISVFVEKKIDSVKRSILYDIQHKTDELKHAAIIDNRSTTSISWIEIKKKGLNGTLPKKSLEDFINFEEQLSNNDEYKEALVLMYNTAISSEPNISSAIKKIMTLTVEKPVELEYSGTGRTVQGVVAKRDFSATNTYKCLDAAISERFAGSAGLKNLPGKVGRWLSGAGDRRGGRKNR